jgi:AcrR family transcriptional regulator
VTASSRPLRRDAERNRQRILAAARALVAEKGLGVSYEEIAREADVAVGTVYNRFPDRAELVDALFRDQVEHVVELAQRAQRLEDPWEALVQFMTGTLALQATNRGLRELVGGTSNQLGLASVARQRIAPVAAELVERAQDAGLLRRDIGVPDISLIPIMVGAVIDSARDVDPQLWRRALALLLDGLRPDTASELPVAP